MPMQRSTTPEIQTGTRQIPLLHAAQITVGMLITGPTYSSVRKIIEIDGNVVVLEKFPRPPVAAGHLHGFTLHQHAECTCGLRREPMTGILPMAGSNDRARTYVLEPLGELEAVDPFTIYVSGTKLVSVGQEATPQWSLNSVPVVPLLHPIWTVPPRLREALGL